MYNIYGDDDKLNVAAMYVDKTTCDWFLWWDSTMKGGILVRDWDTFKKKFFNKSITASSLIYNKMKLWINILEIYWS